MQPPNLPIYVKERDSNKSEKEGKKKRRKKEKSAVRILSYIRKYVN